MPLDPPGLVFIDAYTGAGIGLADAAAIAGISARRALSVLFGHGHPERRGADDRLPYQWLLGMRHRKHATAREIAKLRDTTPATVRTQMLRHGFVAHDHGAPPIDRAQLAALLDAGVDHTDIAATVPGPSTAASVPRWVAHYRLPDPPPPPLGDSTDELAGAIVNGNDCVTVMARSGLTATQLRQALDGQDAQLLLVRRTHFIDERAGPVGELLEQHDDTHIDELAPTGTTPAAVTVRLYDHATGHPARYRGKHRRLVVSNDPAAHIPLDTLNKLLKEGWSLTDIAALHGTDPARTRQWARQHGLDDTDARRPWSAVLTHDLLAKRLSDPRNTYADIGREVGAEPQLVARHAKRMGIRRTTWADVLTRDRLVRMINDGLTIDQIAARTGASRSTVDRAIGHHHLRR